MRNGKKFEAKKVTVSQVWMEDKKWDLIVTRIHYVPTGNYQEAHLITKYEK